MKKIFLTVVVILLFFSGVNAKDPGDACDPDVNKGLTARIIEVTGSVNVYTQDSSSVQGVVGMEILPGATVQTDSKGMAILALEDGTAERHSLARLGSLTTLTLTGGLYCSDMRPKRDGGRWNVREIAMELAAGEVEIEIASQVSYSFDLKVKTPNAVAGMRRSSQQRMAAKIQFGGLEERKPVPLIEHPQLQQHLALQLQGRSLEDLTQKERDTVLAYAATIGVSLGLIDMEQSGVLDNPIMQQTVTRLTGGRSFDELDQAERKKLKPGIFAMALTMGLIDPEKIEVYDQPDEHTLFMIEAGKLRIHNKHRGWKRSEAVDADQGMRIDVAGREIPTTSRD